MINYSQKSEKEVLDRAKQLIGKNFKDIIEQSPIGDEFDCNLKNKGLEGQCIEKHWFGIPTNSSKEPDFKKARIELKVTSLRKKGKNWAPKEDVKISAINYMNLPNEDWGNTPVREKLKRVLFVFYGNTKKRSEMLCEDFYQQKIYDIGYWTLNEDQHEDDLKPDWLDIKQEVVNGNAHTLSQSDYENLVPKTMGDGKSKVSQPNNNVLARKRAYAFKRQYVEFFWKTLNSKYVYESLLNSTENYELFNHEVNFSAKGSLERFVLKKIEPFIGLRFEEIAKLLNTTVSSAKSSSYLLLTKIFGFTNSKAKIKEFEQRGIRIISVPIHFNKKNELIVQQSTSFPNEKLIDLSIEEDYFQSNLHDYLDNVLFVPIIKRSPGSKKNLPAVDFILHKPFFWTPNLDEQKIIQAEWKRTINEINTGCAKVTLQEGKEVTSFTKEGQSSIVFFKPHATKKSKPDKDPDGNLVKKHCFWLTKNFVKKIMKKSLNI